MSRPTSAQGRLARDAVDDLQAAGRPVGHADRHGAIVVPIDKIDAMRTALDGLSAREAKIIAAAKAGSATVGRGSSG